MAVQKIDPYFEHLQHIPWDDEFTYLDTRDCHIELGFKEFEKRGGTPRECVNSHYYQDFDTFMDENGMEKAVAIIAGMLYQMSKNEVDPQLAYEAYLDCTDLLTGDYDDLIPESDIELLRADIKTIMYYLDAHPKLKEK